MQSLFKPTYTTLFLVLLMLVSTSWVHAQTVPSAFYTGDKLSVGVEGSNFNASFPYQSNQRLSGIGAFVDFNWSAHTGLEASANFMRFGGYKDVTESSYLIGPKYYFHRVAKIQPYAKGLVGVAKIHYPFAIGDASYLCLAPGAGANYRLAPKWSMRGEFEYQLWQDSPGYKNMPNHPIKPNGFRIGILYKLR